MILSFKKISAKQVDNVAMQVNSYTKREAEKNCAFLKPIIDTVLFCGINDSPLRENFDSGPIGLENPEHTYGKCQPLLRFRANWGDKNLKTFLLTCKKKCNVYIARYSK